MSSLMSAIDQLKSTIQQEEVQRVEPMQNSHRFQASSAFPATITSEHDHKWTTGEHWAPATPFVPDSASTDHAAIPTRPRSPTSLVSRLPIGERKPIEQESWLDYVSERDSDVNHQPDRPIPVARRRLQKGIHFVKSSERLESLDLLGTESPDTPEPDSPVTQSLNSNTVEDTSAPGSNKALQKTSGLGHALMAKYGWAPGQGLGLTDNGIKFPIVPQRGLAYTAFNTTTNGTSQLLPPARQFPGTSTPATYPWHTFAANPRKFDNEDGTGHPELEKPSTMSLQASHLIDESGMEGLWFSPDSAKRS